MQINTFKYIIYFILIICYVRLDIERYKGEWIQILIIISKKYIYKIIFTKIIHIPLNANLFRILYTRIYFTDF